MVGKRARKNSAGAKKKAKTTTGTARKAKAPILSAGQKYIASKEFQTAMKLLQKLAAQADFEKQKVSPAQMKCIEQAFKMLVPFVVEINKQEFELYEQKELLTCIQELHSLPINPKDEAKLWERETRLRFCQHELQQKGDRTMNYIMDWVACEREPVGVLFFILCHRMEKCIAKIKSGPTDDHAKDIRSRCVQNVVNLKRKSPI